MQSIFFIHFIFFGHFWLIHGRVVIVIVMTSLYFIYSHSTSSLLQPVFLNQLLHPLRLILVGVMGNVVCTMSMFLTAETRIMKIYFLIQSDLIFKCVDAVVATEPNQI